MKIRILSAILRFAAGWGIAGTMAIALGLNQAIGLLVGSAWAALVVLGPKDLVWRVGKRAASPGQLELMPMAEDAARGEEAAARGWPDGTRYEALGHITDALAQEDVTARDTLGRGRASTGP